MSCIAASTAPFACAARTRSPRVMFQYSCSQTRDAHGGGGGALCCERGTPLCHASDRVRLSRTDGITRSMRAVIAPARSHGRRDAVTTSGETVPAFVRSTEATMQQAGNVNVILGMAAMV